jgi:hypothetical protein
VLTGFIPAADLRGATPAGALQLPPRQPRDVYVFFQNDPYPENAIEFAKVVSALPGGEVTAPAKPAVKQGSITSFFGAGQPLKKQKVDSQAQSGKK